MPRDEDLSPRELKRRQTRLAGDQSAKLARELMQESDAVLGKLELDEELADAITDARRVTQLIARRRAERALAGKLRDHDLVDLAARLASVRTTGSVDTQRQHAAETWRDRLVAEGEAAIPAFPGGDPDHSLPRLVAQAQREHATGKPAGAQRALFRYLIDALRAAAEAASSS
ncbi:MAG TPA: ribosome biogenesis factor YjgA [Kofleriaceae bacterium]